MGVALVVSLLFESGLESATRFSFKYLIDEAVVPRNYERLMTLLTLLGSAAILLAVITLLADYIWAKLGARVLNDLRSELYLHVQTLSVDFFQRRKSGDVLNCFVADADAVESCLVTVVPYGLMGLTGLVTSTSLMATIHPGMALATLVGTVVCFVLPRVFLRYARQASLEMRRQEGRLSSTIQETLQSQFLIKVFGLERELYKRFHGDSNKLVDLTVRANFLSYIVERIPTVSFFIFCLMIIGASSVIAFHGGMTIGAVISFQMLALNLGASIGNLTWLTPLVVDASAGLERINEIFRERPLLRERLNARTLDAFSDTIRFDSVSFSYAAVTPAGGEPPRTVLRNLSLEIKSGQFVVIVGPSGCGKTTVLHLLLRLYDPAGGRVLFDGTDLRDASTSSLRSQIGFVSQDVLLFDTTIRENIRMGKLDATDDEIIQAMEESQCAHLARRLPGGLDTLVGEKGAHLSGGERQRVALARALVRKPRILILDEGTSALDTRSEASLLLTLRRLSGTLGITVIAVTHRLRMAPLADTVVVMREGMLESCGPHTTLLAEQETYASLWEQSAAR
ncbi:MAG: ABC transporter ATP-binding protein [Acidobacteria bacterium]|nr:ABC transporter ATP-binding protein [Acidobacteriota bacterium]